MKFTEIPESSWPRIVGSDPTPLALFMNRLYLVQWYEDAVQLFGENILVIRLSVNRTKVGGDGRWKAEIPWDDLQEIKTAVGLGDRYAIEIYPRDRDVVNVANMRHLWVLPEPLPIGWRNSE